MGQRDAQVWTATVKPEEATSEARLIDHLHDRLGAECPLSSTELRRAMVGCLAGAKGGTFHVAVAEVDDD